jgi:hypothetical protein
MKPIEKYHKKRKEISENTEIDPNKQADLLFNNWLKYLKKCSQKADNPSNNEFYNKQFNY